MRGVRRRIALQLGIAVAFLITFLELKTVSGGSPKWSATTAWTPEGKVATTSEVLLPSGKSIELNKGAEPVRAFIAEGTFSGAFGLELGDGTAPTEAAFSGIILKVTAGATWTHSGSLKFKSTSATRLAIACAKAITSTTGVEMTSGKYEVTENLTLGSAVQVKLIGKTDLKLASGVTLKCGIFFPEGESVVDISNATVVVKEWAWNSSTSPTTTGGTIEITGTGTGQFNGGSKSYNVVKWAMRALKIEGSATVATLEVLNKAKEGEGAKLANGVVITFTALTFNGAPGELCRVESSENGKQRTLEGPNEGGKGYEPANSYAAVKDLKYVEAGGGGGSLYLPHGEDLGGNSGIIFGAKPAAGIAAAVSGGAAVGASAGRIAQSPAASTAHARVAATSQRIAQARAALAGGAIVSAAVVKTERGPVAAKVSTGALVAASLARLAKIAAASSNGAAVTASARRATARAAAVWGGASVAARAQRVSQPLSRVAGGAVVTATVRRVAYTSASITAGASLTAQTRVAITARISAGASVYATVTRVGQSVEPPTSTPVAGHVAVGQRGKIGGHRGRIATGNVGRAER